MKSKSHHPHAVCCAAACRTGLGLIRADVLWAETKKSNLIKGNDLYQIIITCKTLGLLLYAVKLVGNLPEIVDTRDHIRKGRSGPGQYRAKGCTQTMHS